MMSRILAVLLLCLVAGCASSKLPDEAIPLADAAISDVNALDDYLEAAGAEVLNISEDRSPVQSWGGGVQRIRFFELGGGGRCSVLIYESAEVAEGLGPREGGGESYLRRTKSINSGDFVERRTRYKPTYRFGPHVAICSKEPAFVQNALQYLAERSQQ